MRLTGLAPDDLPDPELVFDRHRETLEPPTFRDAEPRIFRSAPGAELDPLERVPLERAYVELEDAAANTEIRRAMAAARIRERELAQEAARLSQAQRRASELETEKWNREDRRRRRYLMLALLAIAVVSTIVMAFLTVKSSDAGIQLGPGTGISAFGALVAGLLLRALRADRLFRVFG